MNEKEIVDNFSKIMLEKIEKRHDRYIPLAWRNMDLRRLVILLREELKELENGFEKYNDKEVSDNAIDIANYGMFIWDLIQSGNVKE